MLKIAVLGSRDTVMGFKALGLEVFPVSGLDDAKTAFRRLTNKCEEYAIIYVEENLAMELQAEIDRFKDMPSPAIILIPGKNGSLGLGQSALNAAVERAIGSSI
ncbi:MAG: V-type ATP synthase subunit F [Oscillospiraceae bacterium]